MGYRDGLPVVTFTGKEKSDPIVPSEGYVKSIALGLRVTYRFDDGSIFQYLREKSGIKGNWTESELQAVINSAR